MGLVLESVHEDAELAFEQYDNFVGDIAPGDFYVSICKGSDPIECLSLNLSRLDAHRLRDFLIYETGDGKLIAALQSD